ncbi:MAG: AAA-like domain-containing protein [Anaerolineae bacterium]|nr:AAA-like domain-containing protein [Anaerolineae bacterium]
MPGLSHELYNHCRNILLKCREFDSNSLLRVVFIIDELAPFNDAIAEAENKKDRVDLCLASLLPKSLKDGRPVLPLFLTALRDRYSEAEALYYELEGLIDPIRAALVHQADQSATQQIQQVFISYKRNAEPDESVAMYLTRFLNAQGKQTFIDQKLKVGMDWVNEIHDQIAQSDFLVVLLSPDSMKSDMVLEEVKFADLQWRETGRPRILPVRLGYEGPLPYPLDDYLRPLQYALWLNETDTPNVGHRILNAMKGIETLPQTSSVLPKTMMWQTVSKTNVGGRPIVEPYSNFDPWLILEAPGGLVDLESPFYIERRADIRLKRELSKAGTTTTIRAPRQMGKTSLLVRGVEHARQKGSSIIFCDFQMIDSTYLQSLDVFLYYLALNIATTLKIDPEEVDRIWQSPLGPPDRLTQFLEDRALKQATNPIVLAIDEADRLFEASFRQQFFALIRAWFTKRGFNPLWKKINIAMVISTHPFLLIDDINQSPFNVGLRLDLEDFDLDQVRDLNERHGAPLNETELLNMMTLLGGHPYLVRQAFYSLIDEEITWVELVKDATAETGPFKSHLRQYLWQLRDKPQLIQALQTILTQQTCSDDTALTRLSAAGLLRQSEDGRYLCRCQLYELYLKRFLL